MITLEMTDLPKDRTRPYAIPHNVKSLRVLAEQIHEHAKKIEEAADLLENAGPGLSVALNNLRAVEAGMTAIRSVVREIEEKVDRKKFLQITDARPEAAAPKKPKRRP